MVDFVKDFHSKAKKGRYWIYVFLAFSIVVIDYYFFLYSSSIIVNVIINSAVLLIAIILGVTLDLGIVDLVRSFHNKLLTYNEYYIVLFFILFFSLMLYLTNKLFLDQLSNVKDANET